MNGRFAQIDSSGICVADSRLSDAEAHQSDPNLILLADDAVSPLGQHWTGTAWEVVASDNRYLSKVNALRLLSTQELIGLSMVRKQCAALTIADYASTDQVKQLLMGMEAWLVIFDGTDQVNLLDPGLPIGLGLMKALGVIASDARIAQIIAGTPPT
jgi:hypothetical protein